MAAFSLVVSKALHPILIEMNAVLKGLEPQFFLHSADGIYIQLCFFAMLMLALMLLDVLRAYPQDHSPEEGEGKHKKKHQPVMLPFTLHRAPPFSAPWLRRISVGLPWCDCAQSLCLPAPRRT